MYNTIQIQIFKWPLNEEPFSCCLRPFTHQQFRSEVRGPTTNCAKTGLPHWMAYTIQGSADQIANIKQKENIKLWERLVLMMVIEFLELGLPKNISMILPYY